MDRGLWGTDPTVPAGYPLTPEEQALGIGSARGLHGSYNYATQQPSYPQPDRRYGSQERGYSYADPMRSSWHEAPQRAFQPTDPSAGLYGSQSSARETNLQHDLSQITAQRDELQQYVSKLTLALKKSEAENEANRKAREETNVMFSYLQDNPQVQASAVKTEKLVVELEKANSERQILRQRLRELENELGVVKQEKQGLEETLQATARECEALRRRMQDDEARVVQREMQMSEHQHTIDSLKKQREELLSKVEYFSEYTQGKDELNSALNQLGQNPHVKQVQKLSLQLDAAKKEAKSAHAQLIKLRSEVQDLRDVGASGVNIMGQNGDDYPMAETEDVMRKRGSEDEQMLRAAAPPMPPPPPPPEVEGAPPPPEAEDEPMLRVVKKPGVAAAQRAAPVAPPPMPAAPPPPPEVVEKIVEKQVVVTKYIEPQLPRVRYISHRSLNPVQLGMASSLLVAPPKPAAPVQVPPAAASGPPQAKPAVPPEQLQAAADRVSKAQAKLQQAQLKLQLKPTVAQATQAIQEDSLRITIHGATNLPKVDMFGSIDPFCEIKLGNQKKSTNTVKRSRNPTWGEDFEFKGLQGVAAAVVTLYDWERMHDNRPIGVVSLPLNVLEATPYEQKDLPLSHIQSGKGQVIGKSNKPSTIKISARYTRGNAQVAQAPAPDTRAADEAAIKAAQKEASDADAAYKALAAKAGAGAVIPTPSVAAPMQVAAQDAGPWTMKVKVIAADHLPQMDVGGTADPYATLKLGNKEQKTKTIKNTLNPRWEEEFIFEVSDEGQSIEIVLMDWDRFSKDDVIGNVSIPIAKYSHKPHSGVFPITKPGSTKRLVGMDGKDAELTLVITPSNAPATFLEAQVHPGASRSASAQQQQQQRAPAVQHSVLSDPGTPVTVCVKLDRKLEDEARTPEMKEKFCKQFQGAVAQVLAVDPERLFVLNLQPGSIMVDLSFLPTLTMDGPSPEKLASDFMLQVVMPGSPLLQHSATQGLVACTLLDRTGQLEAENQFLLDHNSILQQQVKLAKITSNEKAKNIAKRLKLRGVHFAWNKWAQAVEEGFMERERQEMEEKLNAAKKEGDEKEQRALDEKGELIRQADRSVDLLKEQLDAAKDAAKEEEARMREEAEAHKQQQDALLERKHELEMRLLKQVQDLKTSNGGPQLLVQCKSAKHLPKVDNWGWIDAYCVLRVGDEHHKTSIKKGEENPTWDEDITLLVKDPSFRLEITVLDWERVHDDRAVGSFEIPIQNLTGKETGFVDYTLMKHDKTGPLLGENGVESTIQLNLEFRPGASAEGMEELAALNAQIEAEKQLEEEARARLRAAQGETWCRPPFQIEVNILGCRHLPKTDTFGKCDPYCVVTLGTDERKTNRVEKTFDPDFNEKLLFHVKRPQSLTINVWDWDRGRSDELVGCVDVPVGKLKAGETKMSLPLLAPNKGSHLVGHDKVDSIILLSVTPKVTHAEDGSGARALELGDENGDVPVSLLRPWKLLVESLEVQHLPKTDMMGKCDPYIMLALGGNRVQTKPVKKVYDAKWNDTFNFVVKSNEESLHVTVMDWDYGCQDDQVGNLSISIDDVTAEPTTKTLQIYNGGVPVKGKDGQPAQVVMTLSNKGEVEELEAEEGQEEEGQENVPGVFKVLVTGAKGLPKMDTMSHKADPFLKMTIGGQQKRTETKWKTLEPSWEATFEFDCTTGEELVCEMFDDERLGKSRTMGKFTVPVTSTPKELSCGLQGFLGDRKKTPCCGTVFLKTSFVAGASSLDRGIDLGQISDKAGGESSIEVTIKAVNNLPKMDMMGKCDPYVTMTIEEVKFKTKTISAVYDHTFSPEEMSFANWNKSADSTLEVVVFDHDKVGRDEEVGHVNVDLSKYSKGKKHTATFDLLQDNGKALYGVDKSKRTTVTLELKAVGGPDDDDEDDNSDEAYDILITARTFGHMPKMDTFGSCDPLLKLEMAEREFKTQPVKNSYDGEWNETFRFPCKGSAGKLVVSAWDYDRSGSDEKIGDVSIKIADVFKLGSEYTNRYHIKDKKHVEVIGKQKQKTFVELSFCKKKVVVQEVKVCDKLTRERCCDILKHRGSSCKLHVQVVSVENIKVSGQYYVMLSVLRNDGKVDKSGKTKSETSANIKFSKEAGEVLLDVEPELLLYPDNKPQLRAELIDVQRSRSDPLGILHLNLMDLCFVGVQEIELPFDNAKHVGNVLVNSKGFNTTIKLITTPPKFLMQGGGKVMTLEDMDDASSLDGIKMRVDNFVKQQKDWAHWDTDHKEKTWQALKDELDSKEPVASDESKLTNDMKKTKDEIVNLKRQLQTAYDNPMEQVFQSSQVQLFVGVIATLFQILLLKIFVVGT